MLCFMIVFLYLLFVLGSEGITTHSVTGCSDNVILNCSVTELIHEERITFYNVTDCNQAVTDLQVCGQPLTHIETVLVPYCNGKISCDQFIYYGYCPGSTASKLDYRCIPGNDVKDMCDTLIIANTNRIFLSSPNYPSSPTFTDISPCRCSIRGSSITSIQILELALRSASDGTKSSLYIEYGDVTFKPESLGGAARFFFNKRFSTKSTSAEIVLNHNNINRLYMWIEIQGIGIQVRCTTLPTTVAPSTFPPPQDRTSLIPTAPTTGITRATSDGQQPEETTSTITSTDTQPVAPLNDKDITIIILAVLLSLMMCITATIIIVLLRRKRLSSGERQSNVYSGLDRTQRVSGSDGSYQELNTMNDTPQYYNASQDTQHDYQYVS